MTRLSVDCLLTSPAPESWRVDVIHWYGVLQFAQRLSSFTCFMCKHIHEDGVLCTGEPASVAAAIQGSSRASSQQACCQCLLKRKGRCKQKCAMSLMMQLPVCGQASVRSRGTAGDHDQACAQSRATFQLRAPTRQVRRRRHVPFTSTEAANAARRARSVSARASSSANSVPGNTDWFYSESGQRNWVRGLHTCCRTCN